MSSYDAFCLVFPSCCSGSEIFWVTESNVLPFPRHVQLVKEVVADLWRRPFQTRRRWQSASRVKRDSSLNTMQRQPYGNHGYQLQHPSRRFRRRCGVKGRCLKCRCERNVASAKCREMVEVATMGVYRRGCSTLNGRQ
ncbi:hypothetical protein TNCV_1825781 [Trichonephila clavipes]|nr:hypothetical protein TNCV_1825781 [Trichonephila clavipes]